MKRPDNWDDLIGQANAQTLLKASTQVAIKHNRPLPHILLTGPAGTGKTTIALIVANARGTPFKSVTSTSITSPRDVALLVTGQEANGVLFIDEIHRMARRVQESFFSVMEDFRVTWKSGRSMAEVEVDPFTVIGATTDLGLLLKPMRDRFGVIVQLEEYTHEELCTIIENYSRRSELNLGLLVSHEVSKRAKGTPRIALSILDRSYEMAVVSERVTSVGKYVLIQTVNVEQACKLIGIDEHGLDRYDRTYLEVLGDSYPDPVALRTLASRANLAEVTILTSIEPYLLKMKLIEITSKGRILRGVTSEPSAIQREVA